MITFSGCPGGSRKGRGPNWVTCPWPPDFLEILKWQWNDVAIPYWKEKPRSQISTKCASPSRCTPASSSTTPRRCCKLRERLRREHRRQLRPQPPLLAGHGPGRRRPRCSAGRPIFHVHAKDCKIDDAEHARSTACSTPSTTATRSTAPGSSAPSATATTRDVWNDIISTLRMVGYDGVALHRARRQPDERERGLQKA